MARTSWLSTYLNCSPSVSNVGSLERSDINRYYLARLMVIYLREWAEKHQIKSVFRSHLLVLMVIFFLQVRGYLPSVFQLQSGLNPNVGREYIFISCWAHCIKLSIMFVLYTSQVDKVVV